MKTEIRRTLRAAGLLSVLAVLISACSISVCDRMINGSGNVVSESRIVSGFKEIDLRVFGRLTIEQNGAESLTIDGEDNVVRAIRSSVQGERLVIALQDGNTLGLVRTPDYKVSVKSLEGIRVIAAAEVSATN